MANEFPDIPHTIRKVYQRFERWRRAHPGRLPIPERLWGAAVELAREHGLSRTARTLRLNYYALKKRLPAVEGPPSRSSNKATFVQLLPLGASGLPGCTIKMENARGEKMKIHLPGLGSPELAVLSDRFWRAAS